MEHPAGFEPAPTTWQAVMLPLTPWTLESFRASLSTTACRTVEALRVGREMAEGEGIEPTRS